MKRLICVLGTGLLLGAGCSLPSINTVQSNIAKIEIPTPQEVISSMTGVPEGWSQVSVSVGTSTIRIPFPGTVEPMEGSASGQMLQADLGTAVLDPGEKRVPTTSFRVYLIRPDDKRIKDGAYSSFGFDGDSEQIRCDMEFVGSPFRYCGYHSEEAALGNRYNTYSYATRIDDRILALEFVVHSLVCENFENPEAQCVGFDEARDTAGFQEILSKVK